MIDASSGAVGDGKVACVVRRRVGKGIQGACAPMAERVGCFCSGGGGAVGDLGALGALGWAR